MSYATVAPGQSLALSGAGPPTCANCATLTTPLWRRDEDGNVLCNACGLFLKLHGKPRPISLKTDTIKSRNRVKATGPRKKEFAHAANSEPGSSQQQQGGATKANSGGIRSDQYRNSIGSVSANIAPQHMFDGATLGNDGSPGNGGGATFANMFDSTHGADLGAISASSPSMTNEVAEAAADAAAAAAAAVQSQFDTHMPYEDLRESHATLQTRVSELELINSLLRERCTQLEEGLRETKAAADASRERERDLSAQVAALEAGFVTGDDDITRKRQRMAEIEPQQEMSDIDAEMGAAAAKRALDEMSNNHGQE